MTLLATSGVNSRALWYLTRSTGTVALVLLTITMVLGLTQAVRYTRPGWPRFVVSALHKNASLLAVALLVIHISTAVADSFAPISIASVFIPLAGAYRPFWLGLGALSLDLMLAVLITSLLRERLGYKTWRAVHWAAYASWPIAVLHGLGTGTDTKLSWMLGLDAVCTAAFLGALLWRLTTGWSAQVAARRTVVLFAMAIIPIVVAIWTINEPLKPGWARKAGTPTKLLSSSVTTPIQTSPNSSGSGPSPAQSAPPTSSPSTSASTASTARINAPFSASFSGTQSESNRGGGQVSVVISGSLSGSRTGDLRITLIGRASEEGGVSLESSQVLLGPTSQPSEYQGQVTELSGSTVVASLSDSQGHQLQLEAQLQLSTASSSVTGTVQAHA